MPTINDAIVVSGSGYSTEGNGGRKIIQLKSGLLISALKDTSSSFLRLYKSADGINWTAFTTLSFVSGTDVSLSSKEDFLYLIYSAGSNVYFNAFDKFGTSVSSQSIDTGQNAIGNVSLAINEAKTELHAAWVSKNSTYQSSFNVRYAKGTINADGTVTWGAVVQVTQLSNPSLDNSNPSIVVVDDKPFIFVGATLNTNYGIFLLTNSFTTKDANYNNINTDWGSKAVYFLPIYAQSSPSAIYVPQSINGLSNGRIWVSWNGKSSTSSVDNIKMSYSDDSGVSWSDVIEVTTGSNNQQYPTISCNKRNEVFIVWQGFDATVSNSYVNVRKAKYANGTLSAIETITNNTTSSASYPNSIPSVVDFDSPLFIYTNAQTSSVNFYGSWSVETISPPVGERGRILNRQNILTYNITSESTIGTVTEKINGVVVGTKTLTSGQNTTVNITQAQWDGIPYGKYRNNSAGRNTIEIVTPNNTFTYTFEKWFDNTLDVISATKAVKDSKDYYLPSAKKILSDAINSKGGSTSPTQSIESMANNITSTILLREKTGTSVSYSSTIPFTTQSGGTNNMSYITLDFSTLGFIPKRVFVYRTAKNNTELTFYSTESFYVSGNNFANTSASNAGSCFYLQSQLDSNSIKVPVSGTSVSYTYTAIG